MLTRVILIILMHGGTGNWNYGGPDHIEFKNMASCLAFHTQLQNWAKGDVKCQCIEVKE